MNTESRIGAEINTYREKAIADASWAGVSDVRIMFSDLLICGQRYGRRTSTEHLACRAMAAALEPSR